MSELVWLYFTGWGLLFLVGFVGAYSLSHWAWALGGASADFVCKAIGFVSLILIFVLSGWKAGLLALPVALIASCVSALFLRFLIQTKKPQQPDQKED